MTDEAIDVLVVAYGAPELLDECLGAVGRSFPVTVVDNSSSPEVRTVSERHGASYLDPGSNLGFAAGALTPEFAIRAALGQPLASRIGEFTDDLVMLRYTEDRFVAGSALDAIGAS